MGSSDDPATTSGPGEPAPEHLPPDGVDAATVDAVGKLTGALEVTEHARGLLYGFHRFTGQSDIELADALDALDAAGHGDLADRIRTDLLGRNATSRRWTFQIVEEYDEGYWEVFRRWERTAREELLGGRRHVYEARLKEEERTHGRAGHEAGPSAGG